MTQCDAILAALKRGELVTPYSAFRRWGVLALHSRAAELRERGYDVTCKIVTSEGKRWGEYSLGKVRLWDEQ